MIGRLLVLTWSNEVNAVAGLGFGRMFGGAEVCQLAPDDTDTGRREAVPPHLRGRLLFGPGTSYVDFSDRFAAGAVLKTARLSREVHFDAFRRLYGGTAVAWPRR